MRPWGWSPAPARMPGFSRLSSWRCQCDPGQTALAWESQADIDLFITSHLCDLGQVGIISGFSSSRKTERMRFMVSKTLSVQTFCAVLKFTSDESLSPFSLSGCNPQDWACMVSRPALWLQQWSYAFTVTAQKD